MAFSEASRWVVFIFVLDSGIILERSAIRNEDLIDNIFDETVGTVGWATGESRVVCDKTIDNDLNINFVIFLTMTNHLPF